MNLRSSEARYCD